MEGRLTIASGPVIIYDGKVLLDKHGEDNFWKFPGGKLLDTNSIYDNAIREVKEELNVDVKLSGDPFILTVDREKDGIKESVILIHYLAKIISGEPKPGRDVREFAWHDVNNLPSDLAPNIMPVVRHFSSK